MGLGAKKSHIGPLRLAWGACAPRQAHRDGCDPRTAPAAALAGARLPPPGLRITAPCLSDPSGSPGATRRP